MKPYKPDPIFGIPMDNDEPLYYCEEGEGGYIPISVEGAKEKNRGEKKIGIFRAVNSFHNDKDYDELVALGGKTPRFVKNLKSLRACYCEVDLRKEGQGDEITEEEKTEIIGIRFCPPIHPTFYITTKNGIHLWFVLTEPEGVEMIQQYKECNQAIRTLAENELGLTLDPVNDAARVLRAPNFDHRKSEPYRCRLLIPDDAQTYTISEIYGHLRKWIEKPKEREEFTGEVTQSSDRIGKIPVKMVAKVCWPELVDDPADSHKFLDSENNNHSVAMFMDRNGLNILHPGGGTYVDKASGPFLLVRNKMFPVSAKRTRGMAAMETIEWFCEHFDIEPRNPEYEDEVMNKLKKECMYGEVSGQKCILFPKITDSGETVGLEEVPISDSVGVSSHVTGWLQRRGYAEMVDGTGKILEEGERKLIHKTKGDKVKLAMAQMRGHAATGPEIVPIIRVSGDKHKIRLSDKQGFYEITGSGWVRKGYESERLLIRSDCSFCSAEKVDARELEALVPLLHTFKSGRAGGRFLSAYTVCAHLPFIENPPFLFLGDPNTAKTSKMKTVTAVVDPDDTPCVPRLCETSDKKDVTAAASMYWIICIDNKGNLTADESDFLCTMFSGGKQIRRTLHTNLGVTTQDLRRPCLITAIQPPKGIKTDLWDRFMALESGFGNDSDRMGSMDFDEVLSDALPTVRGACFTIIAELLANPPRARDDVLAAARRKQGWVHYMQGVYSLMGWPVDELLLCLEESNAYVTTNERETTPAFNCLEKVLEELWEGNYSGDEFDVYSNNRVVVDDNEMKITTNMILEKIRRKAGDLRLHPAAVGSLPETGRGLADFFRYGEKWLEEAGLTVEKTLIGKHRLAGWKFTKIERREGV